MSLLPDLENELRRAAARPRRRWWPTRGVVFVAGFALVAGAAGAAGLGLVGPDPDAHEFFDQDIPTDITGDPVRDGVLMPVRTADPDGGPPWGIRVTSTSRGAACVQVGRVVDDQLVALGRDGAFDDDGLAHVIPVGRDVCVATTADGTPLQRSGGTTATSSGAGGASRCLPQTSRAAYEQEARANVARRNEIVPGPAQPYRPATDAEWRTIEASMCPDGAQRALRWGFLGPRATTATHRDADGRETPQAIVPGGAGAYLFVARLPDGPEARLAAIRHPGTVHAIFGGSATIAITGPNKVDEIPGVEAPVADRERGPLEAAFDLPSSRTDPARVRFRAPVDALRYPTAFKAYVETVKATEAYGGRCHGRLGTRGPDGSDPSMPVTPPMRKGEHATLTVQPPRRSERRPAAWCPGTHRLRLIQIGGAKEGYVPLAARTFTVR